VYFDPNEIVSHLVGLKDVRVLSYARRGPAGEITVEQVPHEPCCLKCGNRAWVKDRPVVSYVDLPFGGVPMTICWKKHRLRCTNGECEAKTFTLGDHRIAAKGCMLTTRAAKWVVKEIGAGQTVTHLAKELGCSWDVINAAMCIYGAALLAADTKRLKETTAIGLDETLFLREGPYKQKSWSTTVCDVANHQLIDLIPTRDYTVVATHLRAQPAHRKERVAFGCCDMSRTYRAVSRVVYPKAQVVVDRFHVMKIANFAIDETRRRVQKRERGHRGRKHDPLYKVRKLLIMNDTRKSPELTERMMSLLSLGDPEGEVLFAHSIKEALALYYEMSDAVEAEAFLREIIDKAGAQSSPPEVQDLASTLSNWFAEISAWHYSRLSNGPTE
jgi:transposase